MKTLTPKRRVDILRDVIQCREEQRLYVITFCGVNGVGKSTNLAKVCVHVCACACACVCLCVHAILCACIYMCTYVLTYVCVCTACECSTHSV